jgi:predicted dehydrogenase
VEDVVGFDTRQDRRDEVSSKYGVVVHSAIEAALVSNPDAVVISTPPDLHMHYARLALGHGKHFFCEASVTNDGMADVMARAADCKVVAAPSCTMRFHPAVKMIKEHVERRDIGQLFAFTAHAGQWLPDWHPWEDYRTYYVSKRATGACREIVPFELTWLTWLTGDIAKVAAMRAKVSDLACDIDDIYQILVCSRGGVYGHLMVDVLARFPVRSLRLVAQKGTIEWVADTKVVKVYSADTGEWASRREPEPRIEQGYTHLSPEAMYVDEMRAYTDACIGKAPFPYSMQEDHRLLEILHAAERSSDAGLTLA